MVDLKELNVYHLAMFEFITEGFALGFGFKRLGIQNTL
jgi:hypothetical protein